MKTISPMDDNFLNSSRAIQKAVAKQVALVRGVGSLADAFTSVSRVQESFKAKSAFAGLESVKASMGRNLRSMRLELPRFSGPFSASIASLS